MTTEGNGFPGIGVSQHYQHMTRYTACMTDIWPPPDLQMPMFDVQDLQIVGWLAGQGDDGTEFEGCGVLQTGRCGDHFALVFEPGSYITYGKDGALVMSGMTFVGVPVAHEPGCPAARPIPGDERAAG